MHLLDLSTRIAAGQRQLMLSIEKHCTALLLLQANPLVFFDISLDNNTPLGRITMELKVRMDNPLGSDESKQ